MQTGHVFSGDFLPARQVESDAMYVQTGAVVSKQKCTSHPYASKSMSSSLRNCS